MQTVWWRVLGAAFAIRNLDLWRYIIQSCAANDLWQMVAWLKNAGLPLVARVHWARSGQ